MTFELNPEESNHEQGTGNAPEGSGVSGSGSASSVAGGVSPGEGVAHDAGAGEDTGDGEDTDVGPVELEQFEGPAEPLELIQEDDEAALARSWYIIKVQVNREDSIRDALQRRVKVHGLDKYFGDIVVPTEDVAEFTKTGKRRIVKRKLYPGYIVVHMALNDDTWFLVRETPGIGDFTGSAGKPSPMPDHEIEKILKASRPDEEGAAAVRTGIPFKIGDRVRVKEGNFQNFEGDVASIDQANGRVTVTFLFFGRSTPIEIPHWQIEAI